MRTVLVILLMLLSVIAVGGLGGAAWLVLSGIGKPGLSDVLAGAIIPMLMGTTALGSVAVTLAVMERRGPSPRA